MNLDYVVVWTKESHLLATIGLFLEDTPTLIGKRSIEQVWGAVYPSNE
jgi:hypothetical protein